MQCSISKQVSIDHSTFLDWQTIIREEYNQVSDKALEQLQTEKERSCDAAAASICDAANCGKGSCTEVTKLIPDVPSYECRCDLGWSQAWKAIPFSSCVIPNVCCSPSLAITSDVFQEHEVKLKPIIAAAQGACGFGDQPAAIGSNGKFADFK
ncbi:fibropellin-3-like [Panicum miliaceum]|uniref:Fibropellin-3-like n=1 Tax=Panicum miliaceum TaxID=4540 RepID=A0A3L6PBE2_PANMI|nr:fibropellin-3-like [Panicum miliaceum]